MARKTQDYVPLQRRATNKVSQFPNTQLNLKVNRYKLASINRQWKLKKGKRLRCLFFCKISSDVSSFTTEAIAVCSCNKNSLENRLLPPKI